MPFDILENLIISLEFQSTEIKEADKDRFNLYKVILNSEYKKDVISIVFSMDEEEHRVIPHKYNSYERFYIFVISLKALNREKTLNNSNDKIRNNISMLESEKALFLMSFAMDKDKMVETLKETIQLTQLIETVDSRERNDMMMIQLNLAEDCFSEEDFKEIRGNGMAIELSEKAQKRIDRWAMEDLKEKLRTEVKEEVKEEGKVEGILSVAINMIEKGFSLDQTSLATGLSKTKIKACVESKC